jgi:hypothetical protein
MGWPIAARQRASSELGFRQIEHEIDCRGSTIYRGIAVFVMMPWRKSSKRVVLWKDRRNLGVRLWTDTKDPSFSLSMGAT